MFFDMLAQIIIGKVVLSGDFCSLCADYLERRKGRKGLHGSDLG